jgi:hypothetical protein
VLAPSIFVVSIALAIQGGDIQVVPLETGWRFAADPTNGGLEKGFAKPDFDDSGWKPIAVDRPWEAQGFEGLDGFAWYRIRFDLAKPPEGAALLELGAIDDADEVFVNGEKVGGLGRFPPEAETAWTRPRAYDVPLARLRAGANVIAVRVYDEVGDGGLRGGRHRLSLGSGVSWLSAARTREPSGFPAANFGLAMELAPDGEFPARIWLNPTIPGAWLEEVAVGGLSFREGSAEAAARESLAGAASRRWPFARARYESPRIPKLAFELEAFCPLARVGKPYWGAMPVGFATVRAINMGDRARDVEIVWRFALEGGTRNVVAEERDGVAYGGFDGDALSMRCDAKTGRIDGDAVKTWSCKLSVPAGSSAEAHFCFARSPRGAAGSPDSAAWPDSSSLAFESLRRFTAARAATEAIDRWLPVTGDAALDDALRIYSGAAVQLTKVFTDGNVAIMGYAEMTQRDGYWASFLHTVLFPDLERRMVEEIVLAQDRNGKIPTAILPTIDRQDDLDTNSYAMLRAFRYARWTGDSTFLASIAGNLKGAAAWLGSRDADGDALPDAGSYWCDWKDVKGLADRKVSPHASFLYLAALHDLLDATKTGRDGAQQAAELENRYLRAKAAVDARVESGGLWNGRFYVERWKDGKTAPQVNEDQIVGSLFGEMPVERAMLVFDSLLPNRRPWGVRESFPYRPTSFGYRPGDYANGAVWPWLNYADAWARLKVGRTGDALAILRDCSRQDVLLGSAIPHECLDGETGRALRNAPQAWNASFFGAIFHGLLGVERLASGELQVAPRAIAGPGWRVRVPVAEGEVEVAAGAAGEPPTLRWVLERPLAVRVAVPTFRAISRTLPAGTGSLTLER